MPKNKPPHKLHIRKIQEGDFRAVNHLLEAVFDKKDEETAKRDILFDFTTESKKIGDGYHYWVGVIEKKIVGVIGIGENTSKVFYLSWFAVAREHQEQGIGLALLRHVYAQAKKDGVRKLCVQCGSLHTFKRANALYEKFGFKERFRIKDYWAKNDDLIVISMPVK